MYHLYRQLDRLIDEVDERRLYCQLLVPGATIPLYDMDQPEAVQRLVDRIKAMWREANTSST